MDEIKSDPEKLNKLVWAILLTAFVSFCAIIIGVPLGVRAYLYNSTDALKPALETIKGTVLLYPPDSSEPVGVTMVDPAMGDVPRLKDVSPGSIITTDEVAQAMLTFSRSEETEEVVLSTVQLYHNTRLELVDSETPRYAVSPHSDRIILRVDAGQVRVVVSPVNGELPQVIILTPHGQAELKEGSYSLRVTVNATEVVVRYGQADVSANGAGVRLATGQRTEIPVGEGPLLPLPAAQNLVVNGNFTDPLVPAWQVDKFQSTADAVPGEAEIVTVGGRKALFFSRMGENGIHTEVGVSQVINRDVLDFDSLILRLDVNLIYQSLSGGGYLSSEFPVMVRIDYKDLYGIDRFWAHGFYYQNVDNYPIQQDIWGNPLGEQIPHAVWYSYESPNLLTALGDLKPARIHSIRIYASGWNFQSMVAEVGLIAE